MTLQTTKHTGYTAKMGIFKCDKIVTIYHSVVA